MKTALGWRSNICPAFLKLLQSFVIRSLKYVVFHCAFISRFYFFNTSFSNLNSQFSFLCQVCDLNYTCIFMSWIRLLRWSQHFPNFILYFILYSILINDLCKIDTKFPRIAVRLLWFSWLPYIFILEGILYLVLVQLDWTFLFLCISTSSYANLGCWWKASRCARNILKH